MKFNNYLAALLLIPAMSFAGEAEDLIAEAEVLNKEARTKQYAWVATGRYINDAVKAAQEGRQAEAILAARSALALATASLEQASNEQRDWKTRQLGTR